MATSRSLHRKQARTRLPQTRLMLKSRVVLIQQLPLIVIQKTLHLELGVEAPGLARR